MNPQHTLPIAIGGKATLPGGTIVEILGIHNGQVGLMVTEANGQTVKRPRKRGSNGRGHSYIPFNDCDSPEQYWQLYDARKGWAAWWRKYGDFAGWRAAHPETLGQVLGTAEARTLGFDCTGKPMSEGMRAAYDGWEERWHAALVKRREDKHTYSQEDE